MHEREGGREGGGGRDRDRERKRGGGGERDRDRERQREIERQREVLPMQCHTCVEVHANLPEKKKRVGILLHSQKKQASIC